MSSLWVDYGGFKAQVPYADGDNVYNLAETVKAKFAPLLDAYAPAQLTLHLTAGVEPLDPGMLLSDIPDQSAGKSTKSALIVKVTGAAGVAGKVGMNYRAYIFLM